MIEEMIIEIKEKIQEKEDILIKLNKKTYTIFQVASMINDREEYDHTLGAKRALEVILYKLQARKKDKEIEDLKFKIMEAEKRKERE